MPELGRAAWLVGKRKTVGLELLGLERESLLVSFLPEGMFISSGLSAYGSLLPITGGFETGRVTLC